MSPASTLRWFLYAWLQLPLAWALLAVSAVLGFYAGGEQLRYLAALAAAACAMGQLRDGEWVCSRQAPALRIRTEAVTLSLAIFIGGTAATVGSASNWGWSRCGLTWLTVLGLALILLRVRAPKAVISISLVSIGWAIPLASKEHGYFGWLRETSPPSPVHVLPALGLVLASYLCLCAGSERSRS